MFKGSFLIITFVFFTNSILFAQESEKITGTIGKEKMGPAEIVICVYGTKACMPVNVDTAMTVNFNGKRTKLKALPFGLYLEAEIKQNNTGKKTIKSINVDENKTVICFMRLDKSGEKKLNQLLKRINGVKNFKINSKSSQVFIKYDSKKITYTDLENKISQTGFELE